MKLKLRVLGAPLALLCAKQALAEGERSVSIRTYGTVGFSKLINKKEKADLNGQSFKYDEVSGIPKKGTFMRDTRLGLNIQAPVSERVTAVAQLNAQGADQIYGARQSFDVKSSLLFLRFELVDRLKLMVGQTFVPIWMISEEQTIGITYPWVRPPEEVYAMGAPQGMVGARMIYEIPVGDDLVIKPQLVYGDLIFANQTTKDIYTDAPLRTTAAMLDIEHSDWLVRGSYGVATGEAVLTRQSREEVANPTMPDLKTPVVVTTEGVSHPKITFGSVGGKATFGDAMIMGEYANRKMAYRGTSGLRMFYDDGVDNAMGYQLTAGYTIGGFTPLIGYAFHKNTFNFGAKGQKKFDDLIDSAASTYITANADSIYAAAVASKGDAIYESAKATKGDTIYAGVRAAAGGDAAFFEAIKNTDNVQAAATAEATRQLAAAGVTSPSAAQLAGTKAAVLASDAFKSAVIASDATKTTVLADPAVKASVLASAETKASVLASVDVRNPVKAATSAAIKRTSLYPMDQEQSSVIFGCNYSISDGVLLKVQYQITNVADKDNVSRGVSVLPRGAKAQTLNTAIEFVY